MYAEVMGENVSKILYAHMYDSTIKYLREQVK